MPRKRQRPQATSASPSSRKGLFHEALSAWNDCIDRGDSGGEAEALARATFHLADPAWIVQAPVLSNLPKDHPWRRHANHVRDGMEAAVERGLDEARAAPLKEIPRRSPLAPWVFLIRAIDAAYREERPEVALRFLERIDEGSAVGAPARVLRSVLEGTSLTAPSKVESRLFEEISGIDVVARQRDLALETPSDRAFLRALENWSAIYHRIRAVDAQHAERLIVLLGRLAVERDVPPRQLHEFLQRFVSTKDRLRVLALCLEVELPRIAIQVWCDFLDAAVDREKQPWVERLVLRRCVGLQKREEAEPGLYCDDDFFDDEEEEVDVRERLLEVDPSSESYELVLASLSGPDEREAHALRWHERHPEDIRPLLLLTEAAEKRDAVRKALSWQQKAEAIGSTDPRVRRGAFRLLLRSAEKRIAEGKWELAAKDVDRLMTMVPEGREDAQAFVHGWSWVIGAGLGDEERKQRARAEFQRREWSAALVALWLSNLVETSDRLELRTSLPGIPPIGVDIARGIARAMVWCRRSERPFEPLVAWKLSAETLERLDESELLHLSAYLHDEGRWPELFETSRRGLEGSEGYVAHYLRYRAAYWLRTDSWMRERRDRATGCLVVARALAQRTGDSSLLAELDRFRTEDDFYVDEERWYRVRGGVEEQAIRSVLEEERRATPEGRRRRVAKKAAKKKAKKAGPRSVRGTGSLFEDLEREET